MPVHLLGGGGRFSEWRFEKHADLASVLQEIGARVREVILPWVEEYSNLASVRRRVRARHGLVRDRTRTAGLMLAAIDVADGHLDAAVRRLEDALRERTGASAKTRHEIEDVLRRILGAK